MTRPKIAGSFALVCVALVPLATACISVTQTAVLATPGTVARAPVADRARVFFMRPSRSTDQVNCVVTTGDGRFLGNPWAEEYFAVDLEPGEYDFVACTAESGEHVDRMHASLAAGGVYYVLLSLHPQPMGRGYMTSLSALTSRRDEWASLEEYFARSSQVQFDEAQGRAFLEQYPEWVERSYRESQERWDRGDEAHRAVRTLAASDGMN